MSDRVRMPALSLIVARSSPGDVIGRDNKLPWRLKSDLKRFKQITAGRAVIMGRKTFQSIGRPLPGRANIVLSGDAAADLRHGVDDAETQFFRAGTIADALLLADVISMSRSREEIFILGGQTIYELFLNHGFVERIYLTEVFADAPGDAWFKARFPETRWNLLSAEDFKKNDVGDEYDSRFSVYERADAAPRFESASRLTAKAIDAGEWLTRGVAINQNNVSTYIERHIESAAR
jgi:dihydrofolate reductase